MSDNGGVPGPPAASKRDPKAKRLGELLKARRQTRDGTPQEFRLEDVADLAGISRSTMYRIENGKTSLQTYTGEQTLTILRAYTFTTDEIERLAKEYRLNIPAPRPAQSHELPHSAIVHVPFLGAIGQPTNDLPDYETNEHHLRGHAPHQLRARYVGESAYATPSARVLVTPPTYLFQHVNLEPKPGQICVFRSGGLEYLGVHGDPDPTVLPYDPALPPRHVKGTPELVGVVIPRSGRQYL